LTLTSFSGIIEAEEDVDTETLLTVKDAALKIGVSESAIRNATLDGRLPYVLKFNRKLIEETALLVYQQRTQANGEKPKGRPRKIEAAA
jgi:hypothetical protein